VPVTSQLISIFTILQLPADPYDDFNDHARDNEGDDDDDKKALALTSRKDLVPASDTSLSATKPVIDKSSGNYVFIQQMPGGGSYAVEVGPLDFAPLAPRPSHSSLRLGGGGGGSRFQGEFCERHPLGPGMDSSEVALDEEGLPLEGDNCPVNNSDATVRNPSIYTRGATSAPGLLHYATHHLLALQEAIADEENAAEIALRVLDLLWSLVWICLQVAALALLAVSVVLGGVVYLGLWKDGRSEVRRLLHVIVTPEQPSEPEKSHDVPGLVAVEVDGGTKLNNLVISTEELGKGSNGTVVFKGTLESRPVAIKRMLSTFQHVIDRCLFSNLPQSISCLMWVTCGVVWCGVVLSTQGD
jgi:hypothetical protein